MAFLICARALHIFFNSRTKNTRDVLDSRFVPVTADKFTVERHQSLARTISYMCRDESQRGGETIIYVFPSTLLDIVVLIVRINFCMHPRDARFSATQYVY